MQMATGSYTGDGNDDRWINDPGFQPHFVVVKGDVSENAVWRSSDMPNNESAFFQDVDNAANHIQDFGANGFQIGTAAPVNTLNELYYWCAIRDDGADDFHHGTYDGDGNDDRDITDVAMGFTPTIAMVKRDNGTQSAVWRVDENAGDDTNHFNFAANAVNEIQSLIVNGFQVGTDSQVNANLATYYYVTFADAANFIETGSYAGNGVDDRWINDAGFEPDMVWVKGDIAQPGVMRLDTMPAGESGRFIAEALVVDKIQAFGANGFQVGTDNEVNADTYTYYWAVWRNGSTGSSSSSSSSSSSTSISSSSSSSSVSSSSSSSSSASSSSQSLSTSTSTSTSTSSSTSIAPKLPIAIGTHVQSHHLSIAVYKPAISSYDPKGTLITDRLADQMQSYSHTITAIGGYWSASMFINYSLRDAEDWMDRLGYHVEVYSPELVKVWEGFINKVKLNLGALTIVRGPLLDIANRAKVEYSTIDWSVTPPIFGRGDTAWARNAASQDRYGIVEKAISAAGRTPDSAVDQRDTWLAENALPETSHQFNSSGMAQPSVEFELLGYVHWLKLYAYNQTTNTGSYQTQQKIEDVLDADPNSLFTNFTGIETPTNPTSVKRWENDDNDAWGLIKSIVSLGDEDNVRWLFGMYNDRRAEYRAVTDVIRYQQRITDPKVRLETLLGEEVKPWNVRPGYWLFYPDIFVGRAQPANRREDIRFEFLESVTYVMPWGLMHSGSKVGTLEQKLAKLGLGTVG